MYNPDLILPHSTSKEIKRTKVFVYTCESATTRVPPKGITPNFWMQSHNQRILTHSLKVTRQVLPLLLPSLVTRNASPHFQKLQHWPSAYTIQQKIISKSLKNLFKMREKLLLTHS
jgi:hypothetical protein